jgi:hypothetical protein
MGLGHWLLLTLAAVDIGCCLNWLLLKLAAAEILGG